MGLRGIESTFLSLAPVILFHRGINDPFQNEWHFGSNPLNRERHMKKKPPPGRGKKPRDKKTNQSQKASYSRDSTLGFECREGWSWTSQSQRSKRLNDESCDEPLIVGSQTEMIVLGLPLDGPIKIDDVKNAFRSSALKWHPDKHHGPSQISIRIGIDASMLAGIRV